MGRVAAENASLVVLLLGLVLVNIAVFMPYWGKNAPEDSVRDDIGRHRGLWIQCTSYATGNWDCDDYNIFFIYLPVALQAARGFGLVSIIATFISLTALIVGMKCTRCKIPTRTQKHARFVSAGVALVAGVCIIIAASWYAHMLYQEYYRLAPLARGASTSVSRMIFGDSLFIAWAGGVILIIAAIITLCSAMGDSDEDAPDVYNMGPPMYGVSNKAVTITDEYV